MGEGRSAEERINLWYQWFTRALALTQQEWDSTRTLSEMRPDAERYVLNAQEFVDVMVQRNTYWEENSAEVVADRLAMAEAAVEEALRVSPAPLSLSESWEEEDAVTDAVNGRLVIDTSPEQSAEDFAAVLARLDARLAALTQEDAFPCHADRTEGMSY